MRRTVPPGAREVARTTGKRAEPFVPPPPAPRELVDVIGIGRTEMVAGVSLTLLALERYREGDIVTFRIVRKRGFSRDFPSPELLIAVGPASATELPRYSMMSGGGGGGMNEIVYRMSYGLVPGMPLDATDWIIEVREVSWVRDGMNERKVSSVDAGPWRFTVKP